MGKKQLRSTVYVTDDTGEVTRHDPGTPYTAKLGKVITNQSAWADDEPEPARAAETPTEPGDGDTTPSENTGDQTPASGAQTGEPTGEQTSDEADEVPPRAGPGSSRDAWAKFAEKNDVQVPEGASRDDIIGFLEEREIIAPAEQA